MKTPISSLYQDKLIDLASDDSVSERRHKSAAKGPQMRLRRRDEKARGRIFAMQLHVGLEGARANATPRAKPGHLAEV